MFDVLMIILILSLFYLSPSSAQSLSASFCDVVKNGVLDSALSVAHEYDTSAHKYFLFKGKYYWVLQEVGDGSNTIYGMQLEHQIGREIKTLFSGAILPVTLAFNAGYKRVYLKQVDQKENLTKFNTYSYSGNIEEFELKERDQRWSQLDDLSLSYFPYSYEVNYKDFNTENKTMYLIEMVKQTRVTGSASASGKGIVYEKQIKTIEVNMRIPNHTLINDVTMTKSSQDSKLAKLLREIPVQFRLIALLRKHGNVMALAEDSTSGTAVGKICNMFEEVGIYSECKNVDAWISIRTHFGCPDEDNFTQTKLPTSSSSNHDIHEPSITSTIQILDKTPSTKAFKTTRATSKTITTKSKPTKVDGSVEINRTNDATASSTPNPDINSHPFNIWIIILLVVFAILVGCLILFCLFLCYRHCCSFDIPKYSNTGISRSESSSASSSSSTRVIAISKKALMKLNHD